jgi:hypothetical protein
MMFENFSNREIVFFLWVGVFALIVLTSKRVRKSVVSLLGGLTSMFFFRSMLIVSLFTAFAAALLYKSGYGYSSFVKDSIFWFFSVGMVMWLRTYQIKEIKHFQKTALDTVKWTIILEFIVNFYTFSFFKELALSTFLLFVGLTELATKNEKRLKGVNGFFSNILSLTAFGLLLYVGYRTFQSYNGLLTLDNAYALLWPPALALAFLPLIYFYALYMNYESLFVRLKYFTKDETTRREVQRKIFNSAGLNLKKLLAVKVTDWKE